MLKTDSNLNAPATQLWLYQQVFANRLMRLLVVCVISVLLLQPALLVYANADSDIDTLTDETVVITDTVIDSAGETPRQTRDEEIALHDIQVTADTKTTDSVPVVSTFTGVADESVKATSAVPTLPTKVTDVPTDTSPTTSAESTTANDEVAKAMSSGSTTLTTLIPGFSPTTTVKAVATTGLLTLPEELATSTNAIASSTNEAVPLVNQVQTDDSFYQFSRETCVRVGDGSFYCSEAAIEAPVEDQFYVALDSDGDKEIFIRRNGVDTQITKNHEDDAAPYYDAHSETLVWHRLTQGRYQIISYDFTTGEEAPLTSGRNNSMQPARLSNTTVWQQWRDGSWDIVLFDGAKTTYLGEPEVADIAPSITEEYIIWNRVYQGQQLVVVYDRVTGVELTVPEESLGSYVRSARVLLVLEGVTPTGDTVIRGYDPVRKEIIPIETLPAPLPEKLPSSEPTDEIRALVPTKPKEVKEVDSQPDEPDTNFLNPEEDIATADVASSSDSYTLVLQDQLEDSEATITSTTTSSSASIQSLRDEYTLVIPPHSSSTTH